MVGRKLDGWEKVVDELGQPSRSGSVWGEKVAKMALIWAARCSGWPKQRMNKVERFIELAGGIVWASVWGG